VFTFASVIVPIYETAISEQPDEISHNMVLYGQGFRGLLVDFPLKFLGDQRARSLAGTASILMQHIEAKKRIVARASHLI
jgi:hypothetical protein